MFYVEFLESNLRTKNDHFFIEFEFWDSLITYIFYISFSVYSYTLTEKGGTILVLGLCEEVVDADFMGAVLNELSVQFSYCSYSECFTALTLMERGLINTHLLITREIPLEDVVEKGFKELARPDSHNVKILVHP